MSCFYCCYPSLLLVLQQQQQRSSWRSALFEKPDMVAQENAWQRAIEWDREWMRAKRTGHTHKKLPNKAHKFLCKTTWWLISCFNLDHNNFFFYFRNSNACELEQRTQAPLVLGKNSKLALFSSCHKICVLTMYTVQTMPKRAPTISL